MAKNNENIKRIIKLIIGISFVLVFYFVNARQYSYGFLIYLIMAGLSILYYFIWGKISKVVDLEGISDKWKRNALIGLGLAVLTIVLGKLIPSIGAIGVPSLSQSIVQVIGITGRFFIIVVFASFFESVFIVDALTDFFNSFLGFNKIFSVISMAVVGASFHFFAYGSSLVSNSGSFFSAFVIFALFGWLAEYQNDLSGVITWHGGLNWWIEFGKKILTFA